MNVHDFLTRRAAELEETVRHLPDYLDLARPPANAPYWIDDVGRPVIAPAKERAQDAEALRLVLEVHKPDFFLGPDRDPPCPGCGLAQDDYVTQHIDDCPTLRALAWRFREFPDWSDAWTPTAVGGKRVRR